MSGPVGVLLDLLFPPKCVFCGRLLTSGAVSYTHLRAHET